MTPQASKPNLLTVDELAVELRLASRTVRNRASYAPETLPPRCYLPGSSRAVYRRVDVERFIADHVVVVKRKPGRPRNV